MISNVVMCPELIVTLLGSYYSYGFNYNITLKHNYVCMLLLLHDVMHYLYCGMLRLLNHYSNQG